MSHIPDIKKEHQRQKLAELLWRNEQGRLIIEAKGVDSFARRRTRRSMA